MLAASRLGVILGDQAVKRELDAVGYAVRPWLTADELDALARSLGDLGPAPDDGGVGCWHSTSSRSEGYAGAARARVRGVLDIGGSGLATEEERFVLVWSGPASGVGVHRVGSSDGSGLEVEAAMDPCDSRSGEIWVVPGSHLVPLDGADGDAEGCRDLMVSGGRPVSLDPGDALVMHAGLVRCSLPNEARPKRSIAFQVAAPEWIAAHASGVGPSMANLSGTDGPSGPPRAPNPTRLQCWRCGDVVSPEAPEPWQFLGHVRCPECASADVEPTDAALAARRSGPTVSSRRHTRSSRRPILRDAVLDDRLSRDGFVVPEEPILSPSEVERVRRGFGDLHGWEGSGHLNDFNHRSLRYRAGASELMQDVIGPHAEALFVDFAPFLRTFLCKWPGDEGYLEPHQDWTYVDERDGERAVLVFVALQPIGADNGEVRILRGSHRLDDTPRGTGMRAPWLSNLEVIQSRMEPIHLAAGQCAIWDSATVHTSPANTTAEPRLAAGLWMARRGVPLVHCRRIGDTAVEQLDIDADFYRRENPFRLMMFSPPAVQREVIDLHERTLDPVALADEISRVQARGRNRLLGRITAETRRLGQRRAQLG